MSISKTMLTGGNFQDSEGNVLANGYLKMVLSSDESVNDSQICSGISLNITLDGNGSAAAYPTIPADQYVWANDVMSPTNSFYTVTGYTSAGQPAWGPNNQQVTSGGVGGGTFDIGTWVPNQVISWSPSVQSTELEVNGSPSSSQSLLNLVDSASVTVVDNGDGAISFDASSGAELEVNGSPASSQSLQNLVNSGTVTVVDNGDGAISFDASSGAASGSNIAASLPWSAQLSIASGPSPMNGTSNLEIIPATSIVNTATSFKVSVYLASGTFTTTQIFVIRTLKASLTTTDITPITFGGVPNPTFSAVGFHTSDAITLGIDTAHDYYFILEVPYPGGGGDLLIWQTATAAVPPYNAGSTNTGGTDLTVAWASAVPALGTALPVGAGAAWMAGLTVA
jgi:hypothetical protein